MMKSRLKCLHAIIAVITALLAFNLRAAAQTQSTNYNVTFGTSGQSLWTSGSSQTFNWNYPIWYGTNLNYNPFYGSSSFGYGFNFNASLGIGFLPWFTATDGSISLNDPGTITVTWPADGTCPPGQWFNYTTSWSAANGALSVNTPNFDFGLNFWLTDSSGQNPMSVGLSDYAYILGIPINGPVTDLLSTLGVSSPISGPSGWNQPGANSSTIWHAQQGLNLPSGNFDLFDGIISGSYSFALGQTWNQSLDQNGNGTLVSSLADFNLDGSLSEALGEAVDIGWLFKDSYNWSDDVTQVNLNWQFLDFELATQMSLPVSVAFNGQPQMTLQFSQPVWVYDYNTMTTGLYALLSSLGPVNVGDDIIIMPDGGVDITPTFSLTNTLTSSIALQLQEGLTFQPFAAGVDIQEWYPIYGWDDEFNVNVQALNPPLDIFASLFGSDATQNFPLISTSWELQGIQPVSGNGITAVSQPQITATAGNGGTIAPSGVSGATYGGSMSFTATPNTNYLVDKWYVDGNAVQTGGMTFELDGITEDHTVDVEFLAASTVTPSAGNHGTISPSSPVSVASGGSVTFTATPDTGYKVWRWLVNGTATGTADTTYTLSNVAADTTVEVDFTSQQFTITPDCGSHGKLSPSTNQKVNYGSSLTFTATPDTGYKVLNWKVNGQVITGATGNTYTLSNITAQATVSVRFTIQQFTVTTDCGGHGKISPSPPQRVNYGGNITYTATPDTGYAVSLWAVNGVVQQGQTGNTFTLKNVTAVTVVKVRFQALPQYTVTPDTGSHGKISPSTAQKVYKGGSVTFTATPDTGYVVALWKVNGQVVTGANGTSYTLSNVTANATVGVRFKVQQFAVTPDAGTGGTISPATLQKVDYGGNVTFTAKPNTGYAVSAWKVNGTSVAGATGTSFTLKNITANATVSVRFQALPQYTVTPDAGSHGKISPSTAQKVYRGSSVTFTATPDTGYQVSVWKVNGTIVAGATGNTFILPNVAANATVSVRFSQQQFKVTPSAGSNGTISPSTVQTVNYGGSVTFKAAPNSGHTVSQWLVSGTAKQTGGSSFTLKNVTADTTVNVQFVQAFTVTPSVHGSGGTISPSTVQTVASGGSITFTATPDIGGWVGWWLLDGSIVQTGGNSYTLSNVKANHTLQVLFNQN
jgi:hypothetical protein